MVNEISEVPFTIEDRFIISKTGRLEDCEDAIYIGPHFIAVIDGATSKTKRRWNGDTGGKVAARIISESFRNISYDATAHQAFSCITLAIREFYESQKILDIVTSDALQRIMASVVVISFFHKEVWSVGDCQCLLDHTLISHKSLVDQITSRARAMFLEAEILKGVTIEELLQHDTGRAFILSLLERQSQFQNNPIAGEYEYSVVDGFPIPDDRIFIQKIPKDVETLVLATDGYPILKDSLEASEHILQEILCDDPLLFRKYKSTKGVQKGNISFDDRAYMKVRWKQGKQTHS